MVTRPDVKGRLAWSTIAQMSFTLLLCGQRTFRFYRLNHGGRIKATVFGTVNVAALFQEEVRKI